MRYFVKEVRSEDGVRHTAGIKARDDINDILENAGYQPVFVENRNIEEGSLLKKLKSHKAVKREWEKSLTDLKSGDELVVQFPPVNHSLYLYKLFEKFKREDIKVSVIIHDMDALRFTARSDISRSKKIRVKLEEQKILESVEQIIAHNDIMAGALRDMGLDNIVSLEIFDYLINGDASELKKCVHRRTDPVIIAGALRRHKAGYAYDLPSSAQFNLYGVGYEGEKRDNVHYFGSFAPDDLPYEMKGSFGLVWDGDGCDTCRGAYGEYLRINNPHKTSLYLASGIPVAIWDQAALAGFIKENNCGILISSLEELGRKISSLSDGEYAEMAANADKTGEKLRNGYYTKKALGING